MNTRNNSDEITYHILDALHKERVPTQRALADELGIALGLVNSYIKRLYNKGFLKAKNMPRNRIKYIITPKGFAEKAKITYRYMQYSVTYYKTLRQKIENIYHSMIKSGIKNILLWGDGEIAEICYISTRGIPVKIIGIVKLDKTAGDFFGLHVYKKEDIKNILFDAILLSSFNQKDIAELKLLNIDPSKIYYPE